VNTFRKLDFIVADDHPMVRRGVRMVLETEYEDSDVFEAASLDAALDEVVAHPDALLLIDLDMPGMNGIESLRVLRQDFPSLLVAVLTGTVDYQTIIDALASGVNGYILKASPPEELLQAISTIRGGRVYLADVLRKPPISSAPVASRPSFSGEAAREPPTPPYLTPRQLEVTKWLMKGHSNKQIARDLNIGEGTVKIHLAAVFRALGAQNRTDAVMKAAELGLWSDHALPVIPQRPDLSGSAGCG
jgi:DNA-binding NarL/FixJ family response regulator